MTDGSWTAALPAFNIAVIAQEFASITLVEKTNSITTNTHSLAKKIGSRMRIIIKPKAGFISTISVDGVIVATGSENTALKFRLNITKNHQIETNLLAQ